jgi:glycosyltransferase involved in cell wall biosynthesis
MDILVLSPTPSFPTDQGNRSRIANVCQYFKQLGARIHFLYFPREWGGRFVRKEYDGVAAQWDYFDVIPPSKDFVYMTDKPDFGIDDWWDENIGNHIKWKTNSYFYDAIIVNYAFFSKAFEYVPSRTLKILDTHDRLGDRRMMLARHGIPAEFFYTTIDDEKLALNRADVVIAITQSEAEYFRTLTVRPVVTVGHVCKDVRIETRAVEDGPIVFGFLGSDNIVNVRNLRDFFQRFYELHPDGWPNVQFRIAGACCNRLPELANQPGMVLVGRVDSVQVFYESVDCIFVPFMFGTGQKIKVVEALAYGIPLIATVSASDGVYSKVSSHNCGSFAQMIDLMLEFVRDVDYRRSLAADTASVFACYSVSLDAALRALWGRIRQSRACVLVDPLALHGALLGRSRAQIIEAFVPLVSTFDALSDIIEVTNKGQTLSALRLVSQSLLQGNEELLEEAAEHATTIDAEEGAGVIVSIGNTGILQADPSGKVMLNFLTDTFEWPHPEDDGFFERSTVILRNHWTRADRNVSATLKRMAPTPYDRKMDAFDGVLLLARQFDDPAIHDAVEELRLLLGTIYRIGLPITLIDEEGTILRYPSHGEPNVLERLDDFYEVLLQARAEALNRNNILVNLLLTYADLSSLFKILANDCGPIVSLRPPNHRVLGIDGEIITSSPRETAIRIAALAAAPSLCVELARRWRLSVATLVSTWLFRRSLSARLAEIRDGQLHELTRSNPASLS